MEFEKIKELKPTNGEKYIIIENGKPKMVILSYKDYQKMLDKTEEKNNPGLFEEEMFSPPAEEPEELEATDKQLIEIPAEEMSIDEPIEPEDSTGGSPEQSIVEEDIMAKEKANEQADIVEPFAEDTKETLKEELRQELTLDDLPF